MKRALTGLHQHSMGETGVKGEGIVCGRNQTVIVAGRVLEHLIWVDSFRQGEGWSLSHTCFGPRLLRLCWRLRIGIVLAFKCLLFCEILHSKSVIKKIRVWFWVLEDSKIYSFKNYCLRWKQLSTWCLPDWHGHMQCLHDTQKMRLVLIE